jgi:hypothetical protein
MCGLLSGLATWIEILGTVLVNVTYTDVEDVSVRNDTVSGDRNSPYR